MKNQEQLVTYLPSLNCIAIIDEDSSGNIELFYKPKKPIETLLKTYDTTDWVICKYKIYTEALSNILGKL
jgi:hypothetical protein